MAMNRETKRMLQRRGSWPTTAHPRASERRQAADAAARQREKRTGRREFLKEVRGELRKVAWPTRAETINYSIIVLRRTRGPDRLRRLALDYVFGEFVLNLFNA